MAVSGPPLVPGARAAPAAAAAGTAASVAMSSFGNLLLLLAFWLPQPAMRRVAAARQRVARAAGVEVRMAVRRWRTPVGSIGLGTGDGAAAFENQDVAP